jgi:hypothetical protein
MTGEERNPATQARCPCRLQTRRCWASWSTMTVVPVKHVAKDWTDCPRDSSAGILAQASRTVVCGSLEFTTANTWMPLYLTRGDFELYRINHFRGGLKEQTRLGKRANVIRNPLYLSK